MLSIYTRSSRAAAMLIAFFTLLAANVSAQLLSYTTSTSGTLASVATNATGTPLARVNGSGTPGAPCGTGFSVSGFTNATVYNPGQEAVEVTITPNSGFLLNVTGFSASLRRSGSGPANTRYAYSTDGGATWIDQGIDQVPNNASCGTTTTGTWSTTVSVPDPLTLMFRIYGFNAGSGSGALQVLNLSINGSVTAAPACAIPPGLTATLTTATTASLSWTAIASATGYNVRYRPSGSGTWLTTSAVSNSIVLSGLASGTVYECEVESICMSGTSGYCPTAFFTTTAGGTPSASSGRMAIYFNRPVNTAVSTGVNAVYLNSAFADTIIAYINRANYTIDVAMYNYNQSAGYSNIATAINNAISRGVRVRWIYDGSQSNTGLALLSPMVHTLGSPTTGAYGIMHNKFVIIDANSDNPNDAVVSSGSTNWGINQLNTDYNNLLFIQDSALAHAYRDHFNMMWGDTGSTPNLTLSKFGPFKTDLGRHIFTIGGKTVELYFSPADHTDMKIQSAINSANTDLYFGVFTFTIGSCASAIMSRNGAGVYTPGIVDQNSSTAGTAYTTLSTGLGSLLKTHTGSIIYHNKMLIVDPSNTCSDPLVLTGSHNWSISADTKNDENILIIHNDTIANIYYQSFSANYADEGGSLTSIAPCSPGTCGTPSGLSATPATGTALLTWASLPGALTYNIQYRVVAAGTWSNTTSATNSITLTSLTAGTTYEYQVQAVCGSGPGTFSSTSSFTTLAPPCSTPSGLMVSAIDTNAAVLDWIAVSGAASYNVRYRVLSSATWLSASSASNSITLTSLVPGTTYEWAVQVVCSPGISSFSIADTFTTDILISPPPATSCLPPASSATPPATVSGSSATLHWATVPGAVSYKVRYHITGTSSWLTNTSTTNSVLVTGLAPWSGYEFQVQTVCSASLSAYSVSSLFSTGGTAEVGMSSTHPGGLRVIPNPSGGSFSINYSLSGNADVHLAIYDMVGRKVLDLATGEKQTAGEHSYEANLLLPGIYFVKLTAGDYVSTTRIMKL